MGIYFDYDFADGKEVERWLPCHMCGLKKVLIVEYHVKNGPVYALYDDARKLFQGKELKVGSADHLICEDCSNQFPDEESLVAKLLQTRTTDQKQQIDSDGTKIEAEIEKTRKNIDEQIMKLAKLYKELEELKVTRK